MYAIKETTAKPSIFGLFQPFFLLSNTTVSTCVDWTQGTGLPIRGTVWKEQVYCIRNMTVQQAKMVHYGRNGCVLISSPASRLFLKRARWLNGCSTSYETEVFLHNPDDFFLSWSVLCRRTLLDTGLEACQRFPSGYNPWSHHRRKAHIFWCPYPSWRNHI